MHDRYNHEFELALSGEGSWEQPKNEISEGIVEKTGELIRLRKQAMGVKMVEARDQAASAAKAMGWLM